MNQAELEQKLAELVALPQECEWVEFKSSYADPQLIGEYLSALSNAAALHRQSHGYIVWGVEDGSHSIKGTSFTPRQTKGMGNDDLEPWLARLLSPRMEFRIFEFPAGDNKPVVLFQVQAANSSPVAFSGREYIRVGSHKKPLMEFKEKERELWKILSAPNEDWSEGICEGATIDHLDPEAIRFARDEYLKKLKGDPRKKPLADEVPGWSNEEFLNRAKVCKNGRITRTAILLLGKNESTHFLSPAVAQITWVLKDEQGIQQDYAHLGPPFILAVGQVFERVRNLTYRYLPDATLFPIEVSQYDPWVTRELLHNCIAHQDYSMRGRINVVEQPHSLLFTNRGKFLPGSVEAVITSDAPPDFYPNRFLVDAMVNLNLIDTIGSGIPRAFNKQRQRNFPMPTYDLSQPGRVEVCIPGQILDPNYTRMLSANPDLDLLEVITLDRVQKGLPISEFEARNLKAKKLVEGRRPNLYVSAKIAKVTDTMADYLKKRGIDKDYCRHMVLEFLGKQTEASRQEIDGLLASKLSDALDETQKKNFITNLLQEMRREGTLAVEGTTRWAKWRLP